MKFLCGSDFHGTLPKNMKAVVEAEKPDAILYAGDMTPHPYEEGSAEEVAEGMVAFELPIYAVAGNVDDPEILQLIHVTNPIFNLLGMKVMEIGGYHIVGFMDFSLPLAGFGFKSLRTELLNNTLKGLDPKKTIIINHVPPKDTKVDFATAWGFEEHAGDDSLRKVIEEFKPLLVVCGHIHEAKGTDKIGKTTILNTATTLSIVELEEGKEPKVRFIE